MKTVVIATALLAVGSMLLLCRFCYERGVNDTKAKIPACLYLERPRQNDVKPWGFDGKEGVDWYCSRISGGGIYVSLEPWKK